MLDNEQVRERILALIENEEFEEINDRPHIILVARQFRPKITASVLWLRKFNVDISCVKLLPYEIGNREIAFESNILIPLPEARDFIIKTERKEEQSITVRQIEYIEFFKDLAARLKERIHCDYPEPGGEPFYQIPTGIRKVHYEWAFHGSPRSSFGVELHFELSNREANLEILSHIEADIPLPEKELQEKVVIQKEWRRNWSRIYVTKDEGRFTPELKEWAVEKMEVMIKTLQPLQDRLQ